MSGADVAQTDFIVEGHGTVTYPEGTRVFRIVVPPGVEFTPPPDVLVEDVTEDS
jgi:hypothetical protein